MFPRSYWPAAYWPANYWPESDEAIVPDQTDTTGPEFIGGGRRFEYIGDGRRFDFVGRKPEIKR